MAFSLVQHTSVLPGTSAYSLAYTGNVTAGNLLVVFAANDSATGTITTPIANTGTAGAQTWNPAFVSPQQFSTRPETIQCWWAIASGTGSCTVTMTWNANVGDLTVGEFSGASASLQQTTGATAQGTGTSIVLPSLTVSTLDNLVIGYTNCGNQGTPQSPWTNMDASYFHPVFWRPNVAAAAYTPNVTQTSSTWATVLFALGLPSGGPVFSQPFAREYPSAHFGPF